MPSFKIKHITRYTYSSAAVECTNQIMLYPIQDAHQSLESHKITITKNPNVEIFTDYFGNKLGMFSIIERHSELLISSEAEVITHEVISPVNEAPAEDQWARLVAVCGQFPYIDFIQQESFEKIDELKVFMDELFDKNKTPFENAQLFSEYIFKNFEYKQGITSVETNVDEIWRLKAGVCQDFAHILLLMLRRIGIPARYVSGYICPKNNEFRGEGATHAWVEAYLPDYGWIGLDPTNNCIASDRHIRLAVGRNFSDVTPVKGTYKGSSHHVLEVLVSIDNKAATPIEEKQGPPAFSYKADNPAKSTSANSYRFYMEQMQQ
ncbi:transglutaminase family protein [Niabella ginsengisoli]|uniref:Transglutaminase family protein n=1 Tax=Niabella ginsengisoli TaxID=522298 RepID=A0ABS9SQP3_9BACT|nr:transglutaminase family protein [Niabella ginsengisoli]MCH5600561.1 transglutaminase family protein [Niabella ginsengisoli]